MENKTNNDNLGGSPPIFKLNSEQKKIIAFSQQLEKEDNKPNKKILSIKDILKR
jgi:hypothetical protein